jgi:hypothetical protein
MRGKAAKVRSSSSGRGQQRDAGSVAISPSPARTMTVMAAVAAHTTANDQLRLAAVRNLPKALSKHYRKR